MRALTHWILNTFASPLGILAIAALDSTLFFWLPFGVDAATIVLAMRGVIPWWAVAVLVTVGSVAGAALTFWMGAKAGDAGLERYISGTSLNRTRRRIKGSNNTMALAALSLVPPPFPFTPIVLAAGALGVPAATFFTTVALCRFTRFAVEAYLAKRFGPATLDWLNSPIVENFVLGLVVLGVMLTVISTVRLVRAGRRSRVRAAA